MLRRPTSIILVLVIRIWSGQVIMGENITIETERYAHIARETAKMYNDIHVYGIFLTGSYRNVSWEMNRMTTGHWHGALQIKYFIEKSQYEYMQTFSHNQIFTSKFGFHCSHQTDFPSLLSTVANLDVLPNITYKDSNYVLKILHSIIDAYLDFRPENTKKIEFVATVNSYNTDTKDFPPLLLRIDTMEEKNTIENNTARDNTICDNTICDKTPTCDREYNIWTPSPFANSLLTYIKDSFEQKKKTIIESGPPMSNV